MSMKELDPLLKSFSQPAKNIVGKALDTARDYGYHEVINEHVVSALIHNEQHRLFNILNRAGFNFYSFTKEIDEFLIKLPSAAKRDQEPEISSKIKLSISLAIGWSRKRNSPTVEITDLVCAVFEDMSGKIGEMVKRQGRHPEQVIPLIANLARDFEEKEELLEKQMELPAFLKHFGRNLNLLARQDKLRPVFERDKEIRRIMEILCHVERPNSVMLIGEPGVGKTAVAEGLAMKLELEPEKIPIRLKECQIVNLVMNSVVAGTMLRGMFEERMQNIIKELHEKPNLILFIDEAHTIIGAGSAIGAPIDASNVLKAALGNGEVRIIAATTLSEYKCYIQNDEAFDRRFRTVRINEPSTEETRKILFQIRPRLERNYSVRIGDEIIETALELSPRYERHLHLPDKVIGWLDTALVRAEMDGRREVAIEDIIGVISAAAKIPKNMVARNVTDQFQNMEEKLGARVIGQQEAIRTLSRTLTLNKGPLKRNFYRPDGVFLFLGPTGVGKTELAKALAEFLFDDENKMIRLDMSEYRDGFLGVEKLIGAPRGIVGADRGGILTNQLRDNPYSVVLLDEVEKAGYEVLNLFLQAFDEGWIADGRGKRAYLSDAIIIMTSNMGSDYFKKLASPLGFGQKQISLKEIGKEMKRELERRFSPEFINRIDEVVIFSPLAREEVATIAEMHINKIEIDLKKRGKTLEIGPGVIDKVVEKGYSLAYGARFLERTINKLIAVPVSLFWNDGNVFRVYLEEIGVDKEVAVKALAVSENETVSV